MRTLVIANPRSGRGVTPRRWDAIETRLRRALGPLEIEFTKRPGDALRIAREGVRAGVARVVVAGGDGTLSDVVTGLLSADLGGYAEIGVLPLGTGSDFIRTLGVPGGIDSAIEQLAEGRTRTVDAGRVTYRASDGREVERFFANIASVGLSAWVGGVVNRGGRAGGRISYLLGALRGLVHYPRECVSIRVDGELVFVGSLVLAAAANGEFFGGGMRVAPGARPDDGQLDWVIVPELSDNPLLSRLRILGKLPSLYRGTHILDTRIVCGRGERIEARAESDRVRIEVDGELLGGLPARIEVVPDAIAMFGCPG